MLGAAPLVVQVADADRDARSHLPMSLGAAHRGSPIIPWVTGEVAQGRRLKP
jgi:hypothetical protein